MSIKRGHSFASLALTIGIIASSPVRADDFRANFPNLPTSTSMGVDLQGGRFNYFLFTFAIGPFSVQRGFGKSGFPYFGRVTWVDVPTASGASQPTLRAIMGYSPASWGNSIDVSGNTSNRSINSWLLGSDGTRLDFIPEPDANGNTVYWAWSAAASGWQLVRTGAGFTLTDKSGVEYHFADATSTGYGTPNGRLDRVTFDDGSKVDVAYDGQARPLFLRSNRGYAIKYEYLNSGAQVKICGFNLAQIFATSATSCSSSTYVVTINNTLRPDGLLQPTSITDVLGQTSSLTYVNSANGLGSFPQCMTLPSSSACEFTNAYGPQPGEPTQITKADQVRVQTDANGAQYLYGYDFPNKNTDDPPRQAGGPPVQSTSWMNGPGYYIQGYYEDGLLKTLQAPGTGPSMFEYNGVVMTKATWPEGNDLTITRDYAGNAGTIVEHPKPGSNLTAVTRTQTFPTTNIWSVPTICNAASQKLCDKPTAQVDAKGNQTDFTYDPAHGGVLTKTLPAVQVNATGSLIRPQVRSEYAQRYAWTQNGSGGYAQESTPIWLKMRERSCRTTAASGQTCAGGAADEVVTDFDYGPDSGPNNLLLRGVAVTAGGQTLRTCYSYDLYGRKISETQPKAGLAVCP